MRPAPPWAQRVTVKLLPPVSEPAIVVTVIAPSVALVGTVAWIDVGETTLKLAATPWNVTDFTWTKFVPVIVTLAPFFPLDG